MTFWAWRCSNILISMKMILLIIRVINRYFIWFQIFLFDTFIDQKHPNYEFFSSIKTQNLSIRFFYSIIKSLFFQFVPKSLDPSLHDLVISSHFWQEVVIRNEETCFSISTNPLKNIVLNRAFHRVEELFFVLVTTYKMLFCFNSWCRYILPLVNEIIQRFFVS